MLRTLIRRLKSLLPGDHSETDMERELRFHIERETEDNIRKGLAPEEARYQALRNFGGVEQTKEECRDVNRLRWLEDLWRDLRFAARTLIKNRGYTAAVLLTLALGIGANTAIFSVIYGVLLRPLPYGNGERLVVLRQAAPLAGLDNLGFSVKEIADYREQSRSLEDVIEHHSMAFTLFGGNEPERIQAGVVSANFFNVMGVQPLLGRTFAPSDEDHGSEAVLVLSYEYWQRSHGGDPDIVDKVFAMNDRPHRVIGVLPQVPQHPNRNDVYMPTSACPTRSSDRFKENRNARMMTAFGLLKAGSSEFEARTDLSTIAARLKSDYPDSYPENRGYAASAAMLLDELTRDAKPTFLILLATAGLVLLIACANVANLTLARLMRRERELALRTALGAGRGRLIRQLLTESTLLSLAAGLGGIGLAYATVRPLSDFAARFTPRASEVTIDWHVLVFTLVVSILTGILFGLVPALWSRTNLVSSLKEGGSQSSDGSARRRLRGALVVSQVGVSFVLLMAAGLMLRSLYLLQQVKPGFDPERVVVLRVTPNWSRYTTGEQYRNLSLRLLQQLEGQPGVASAAMASTYPMNPLGITNGPLNRSIIIEGQPLAENEPAPQVDLRVASRDYFQTLRLPVIMGRTFNELDGTESPPVAVINQSMAKHRWGEQDPIGRRVSFDGGQNWVSIVGVVGDVRQYGLDREVTDEIYRPVEQSGGAGFLLVRSNTDPAGMIRQLRDSVYSLDPEIAIDHVRTLEDARSESLASPRLTALLLGVFACLALLITATGIAGVMALTVTQRTHEIGIRMALGATMGGVMRMVMRQGMLLVAVGLVFGSALALAIARMMSSLLYGVEPTDLVTFGAVALILAAVAAFACLVPARRITSIDPMGALRSE